MTSQRPLLDKARRIIGSAKGKQLTVEERKKMAIQLAAAMISEAKDTQLKSEKVLQKQLALMMDDPNGKVFTLDVTDQCFRSSSSNRVVEQFVFLLKRYGMPKFVSSIKWLQLKMMHFLGKSLPVLFAPLLKMALRKETSSVILPGEVDKLASHIKNRKDSGLRINLNRLGEAILGEKEAKRRLELYLSDLARPEVEYISVKITTLFSQIHLLDWEGCLEVLSERLRALYRACQSHQYEEKKGNVHQKFVNLDMEESRDVDLTVALFQKVLSEPEFKNCFAGIVLQSYLPESFSLLEKLTNWAIKRVEQGGAPIKIRLVKGANLAMEQLEASLEEWPQAPYTKKVQVDANYKKMLMYALRKEHAKAVHIGVASHNLFDIAYAILLMNENEVFAECSFEMLEGMADHQRRVVQKLVNDVLLYCPSANKEDFVHAVSYLVRRLDENTDDENYLRHSFDLVPGSKVWEDQVKAFSDACEMIDTVYTGQRKQQNRSVFSASFTDNKAFVNEPNTDFSLEANRLWIRNIVDHSKNKQFDDVPIVIEGKALFDECEKQDGFDPSCPTHVPYRFALANENHIEKVIQTAVLAHKKWKECDVKSRIKMIRALADLIREQRGKLIEVMIADAGKTVLEADVEISEAVDFCEYYLRNFETLFDIEDIHWHEKGVVLVTPPWNFPCAIPFGGIVAALLTGSSVIFKPAIEVALVSWHVASLCWKAGVPKEVLQFVLCQDDPVGSLLIQDKRVSCVILTGSTKTAELFLKMRPGIDLYAETGGKNAMIISSLADRDLAIKQAVQSAFFHSGQKCSACSLLILEAEVYDDPHFLKQLADAASSLKVGSAWDLATKVPPLITPPNSLLLKSLTTLEPGEKWLLKPRQDPHNPRLWSPGIKIGVQVNGFTQQNEFFGPLLGVIRAESFQEAVWIANQTPYGLTSGVQSLDIREQRYFLTNIEAGNCYVNRGITGAIVQRQPFGGFKKSCFGKGAKAGGPNYLMQLMSAEQKSEPLESLPVSDRVQKAFKRIKKLSLTEDELQLWNKSVCHYSYYWHHYFSLDHDPSKLIGQDNFLRYVPKKNMVFRLQKEDRFVDILRVLAAALTCGMTLQVSGEKESLENLRKIFKENDFLIQEESERELIQRIQEGKIDSLRLLSPPTEDLLVACAYNMVYINQAQVVINGRIELTHYLREVSISVDYHRYGNLGRRESEKRKKLEPSAFDI